MARFYQTAQPDFSEDFVYQPPWKLMQEALKQKQQGMDKTLGAIELFKGQLDIKHRGSEADTRAAQEIASYYDDRAQQLSLDLQRNPDKARDIQLQISKLGRELQQDRKYGNISQLESTYNNYVGANKKLDKAIEDGDISAPDAAAMKRYHDTQKWKGDTLNQGVWKGEDIVRRPEALDFDKMVTQIQGMDPSVSEIIRTSPDGNGYLITQEAKDKGITWDRIRDFAMGKVMQDPNVPSYYEQRTRFGLSDVFNPKTGKLNIIKGYNDVEVSDGKGGTTTQRVPDYYNNELTSFFGALNPLAYQDTKRKTDLKSDATWMGKARMVHAFDLAKYKSNLKKKEVTAEKAMTELSSLIPKIQPHYVVPLEEMSKMSEKYFEYGENLDNLSIAQRQEYDMMSSMYDNLIAKNGQQIWQAADQAGLIPEELRNSELTDQQFNSVLKDLVAQIPQLEDPNWGVEEIPGTRQVISPDGASTARYDTSQRDALETMKENLDTTFGNFNTEMANDLVVMETYHPVDTQTTIGKIGSNVLDAIIFTNDPVDYKRGLSPRSITGALREEKDRYAVDTDTGFFSGIFSSGQTEKPMQRILEQVGATSVREFIDGGYGTFTYGIDGNNIVVNFKPNNARLAEAGIDIDDSGWEQGGLTMRYENLDTSPIQGVFSSYIKEYGDYVPMAMRESLYSFDERYPAIKQRISMSFGEAKINEGGFSLPFNIPGVPKTEYRIKVEGNTPLLQVKEEGQSWEEAKKAQLENQKALVEFLYKKSAGIPIEK